jgi:hypothetical protein
MLKQKQALGLLATIGLMAAAPSQAIILTFNEVPSTEVIQTSLSYEGFQITSDHFHTYGSVPFENDLIVSNGTTHIGYEAGRGDPVIMARADGDAFSLLSLDVAEFYAIPVADRPNANILEISGQLLGGGSVSHQLVLDGLQDGPGGIVDFQHFILPELFINVVSLEFIGLQWNGVMGGVAMDNLEIADRVSVPEPTSLALFGLGLLGAGLARRRRAK